MFCSNCGTNNKDTAKFCMSCGSPLQAPAPAPIQPQPAAEPVTQAAIQPDYPVQTYTQPPVQAYQAPEQTYQPPVQQVYQAPVQTYQAYQPTVQTAPVQTKESPKVLRIIAHLTMVLGALIMVLFMVLPSITATDYYKVHLDYYGDYDVIDGFTADELKDVSPIELIGIMYEEEGEEAAAILAVIVVIFGIFALLNLLFAGIKKPIPVFIFTVLALLIALVQDILYKAAEMLGVYYQWGIGHYLIYVGAILAIAGGIFYMIVRKKRVRA